MSKSSLSAIKSEISRDLKNISSCESKIIEYDKEILSIINDDVGRNMKESIVSIKRCFSNNLNNGYSNANIVVSQLDSGYDELNNNLQKAMIIHRKAEDLFEVLEKYERDH